MYNYIYIQTHTSHGLDLLQEPQKANKNYRFPNEWINHWGKKKGVCSGHMT